jgi:hypothetical protein
MLYALLSHIKNLYLTPVLPTKLNVLLLNSFTAITVGDFPQLCRML